MYQHLFPYNMDQKRKSSFSQPVVEYQKYNLTHFISEMNFSLENCLLHVLLVGFLLLLSHRITLECNTDTIYNRYIYVHKKYRGKFNGFFNQ